MLLEEDTGAPMFESDGNFVKKIKFLGQIEELPINDGSAGLVIRSFSGFVGIYLRLTIDCMRK